MTDSLEDGLHAFGSIEYTPPSDENTNMAREIYEALKRHSDRVLIVDAKSGREWTGASLLDFCGRLATGLAKEVGLKPNDVVMTICDHDDAEIALVLGIVIAGGGLFGATPSDGYSEIETLCSIVSPDVFVIDSKYHEHTRLLRQNLPQLSKAKIVWFNRPSSSSLLPSNCAQLGHQNGGKAGAADANNNEISGSNAEVERIIERDGVHLVERLVAGPCDVQLVESIVQEQLNAREHVCTYMLTSGSTGRPKVVPSTHDELVHGLYSMISACTNPMPKSFVAAHELDSNNNSNASNGTARSSTTTAAKCQDESKGGLCLMGYGPDEIVAGDLPLDHGAGLNTMFLSLWLGSKLVSMPSFDVDAFWQAVSDYKITASIASTSFCFKLFARLKTLIDSGNTDRWNLDSFKYISCTGAKLTFIELVDEVVQHYPHIRVVQAYGATEIGAISMVHRDEGPTHLHSVGYLMPGLVAKVVDRDSGRQLGPNERGELLLWARSKFKGYRCHKDDDPARIYADCHDDKGVFYRTGDQAHFDLQRRLYIHGRFKETLVLMGDWKILPVELEDLVNEHPLVEISAVVGMPDPKLPGCHAPRAYVKLRSIDRPEVKQLAQTADGKRLVDSLKQANLEHIKKSIYDFVASRTAQPKHLTGGVRVLDEFPRVGLLNKIDYKALKQID